MKLILVGKAAAGKDFLKNRLIAKNFKPGISCTTRLPRKNEVDGVDCEDGVDAKTGAECDGGPAANQIDGSAE